MSEIVIPKAFEFLRTPKRYKSAYGGRGSSKSHSFARTLLVRGLEQPTRVVCGREIQKSIKDSVHQLLSDIIRSNEILNSHYEIQESIIKAKNGSDFKFRGLKHNTSDLKSLEGTDIFWIEEAENVSDNSYEILIPTIRKPNSEIWATFNVKNISDPTYRRFITEAGDDTISRKVSWRDNPFFPEVLRLEMEKLKASDVEAYNHVWEGEPDTRRSGAVFAKQLAKARDEGRITLVPYDPSCEVFTAWDLGWADSTTIWFAQTVGRELRIIDYYESSGEPLSHYVNIVKDKPYNYMINGHFLPHDAAAGNIRGDAVSMQLSKMGIKNQVLENSSLEAGIEMARQLLPMCVFNNATTKDGIFALENYAYEWDEERKTFKSNPRHDWSSHAADGFRYLAHAVSRLKGSSVKPVSFRFSAPPRQSYMGA